jgi:hypothetical protein
MTSHAIKTIAERDLVIGLIQNKKLPITVDVRKGKTRSNEQNRYLWGVCYQTILDEGGEALRGWERDDLHEFFLGSCYGWETIEGFGKKRIRPLKRSSKMTTAEFVDFVRFIQTFMADHGVYIPDPNEEFQSV